MLANIPARSICYSSNVTGKRAGLGDISDTPLVFLQAVWELSLLLFPNGSSSIHLLGRSLRTVGVSRLSLAAPCWLGLNCSGSKDCPKQPSPFLGAAYAKKTNQSYLSLFLSNKEIKSFSSKWVFRAVDILERPPPFFLCVLQSFNIRKRWIPQYLYLL